MAVLLANSGVTCARQGSQPAQSQEDEFCGLYCDLKGYIEQAHTLAQQLQGFGWSPFSSFSWTSRDKDNIEEFWVMLEVLPSADAAKPLITQYDKCTALAIKVWLESHNKEPGAFMKETNELPLLQWQAICGQLAWELAEATSQTQRLKSDTQELFADTQHNLSISTPAINKTYLEGFQRKCTQYISLLDKAMDTLEQATQTAYRLRCWQPTPWVTAEK